MSSPYKGGRNYYEKKGHQGYKKNYSPGSVKQQIFYAKKPKQPAKVRDNRIKIKAKQIE